MRIIYRGTRDTTQIDGYCKGRRFAEFAYRDEEADRFFRIAEYLRDQGYNIDTGIWNWGSIEVSDREEYDDVVQCFKEAKRFIKR